MEEDKEVLLPEGEDYIFGEEAILEDINYINEILKEKLSIEEYDKAVTRISIIKSELRERQKLIEENNNYKAAALKNDDLYKEVCNKNKELEKQLNHKNDLIKQADKDLETDYVPKSLIKEKIEKLEKEISSYTTMRNCKRTVSYALVEAKIKVLQELLRRGEVRC